AAVAIGGIHLGPHGRVRTVGRLRALDQAAVADVGEQTMNRGAGAAGQLPRVRRGQEDRMLPGDLRDAALSRRCPPCARELLLVPFRVTVLVLFRVTVLVLIHGVTVPAGGA